MFFYPSGIGRLGHFTDDYWLRLPPDFWPQPNCNEQYEKLLDMIEAPIGAYSSSHRDLSFLDCNGQTQILNHHSVNY